MSSLPRLASWLCRGADAAWPIVTRLQQRFPGERRAAPWAPRTPLRSHERGRPPLGWPRRTDSLCPRCVKEVRDEIVSGRRSLTDLLAGRPGEIEATIRLDDRGWVIMEKTCAVHGRFEDVIS